VVTALMLFELKQELAQHSALFKQVLTHLDKIEAYNFNSGITQTRRYLDSIKQASHNHLALKVSQRVHYL